MLLSRCAGVRTLPLLRALGFVGDREILELFYEKETLEVKGKKSEGALGRVCASVACSNG